MLRIITVVAWFYALIGMIGSGQASELSPYPDWRGAWWRFPVPGVGGSPAWHQTKTLGRAQQAPLTDEYQKILDDSIADQLKGGQGNGVRQNRKELYYLSADGLLMPARKDQLPPDLRYFKQTHK